MLGRSQAGTGHKVFHGKAFLALAFQRESLLLLLFSSSLYLKIQMKQVEDTDEARRVVRGIGMKWLQSVEAF